MITHKRRRQPKQAIATMIWLSWKSDELDPEIDLTPEEIEYIENIIQRITNNLT